MKAVTVRAMCLSVTLRNVCAHICMHVCTHVFTHACVHVSANISECIAVQTYVHATKFTQLRAAVTWHHVLRSGRSSAQSWSTAPESKADCNFKPPDSYLPMSLSSSPHVGGNWLDFIFLEDIIATCDLGFDSMLVADLLVPLMQQLDFLEQLITLDLGLLFFLAQLFKSISQEKNLLRQFVFRLFKITFLKVQKH